MEKCSIRRAESKNLKTQKTEMYFVTEGVLCSQLQEVNKQTVSILIIPGIPSPQYSSDPVSAEDSPVIWWYTQAVSHWAHEGTTAQTFLIPTGQGQQCHTYASVVKAQHLYTCSIFPKNKFQWLQIHTLHKPKLEYDKQLHKRTQNFVITKYD